jgi:hypothetical protein
MKREKRKKQEVMSDLRAAGDLDLRQLVCYKLILLPFFPFPFSFAVLTHYPLFSHDNNVYGNH